MKCWVYAFVLLHSNVKLAFPEDFIYLVLFAYWFDFGELSQDDLQLDLLEVFSGVSRVARFARRCGLKSRAFEIKFDGKHQRIFRFSYHSKRRKRSFMDLNGEAGMAFLGFHVFPAASFLKTHIDIVPNLCLALLFWPRLCLGLLLRGRWGAMTVVLAIVCSTWSAVNLGTSERDALIPLGAFYKPSVRSANKMVARTGCFQKNIYIYIFGSISST